MHLKDIIIENDCAEFPLSKRLRRAFQDVAATTCREVAADDESLCLLHECSGDISRMKSTVIVSKKKGYSIEKVGAGTGNPACDYDIEFIYGCPHKCAFCQQLCSYEETPYIAIYPDLQRILLAVQETVHRAGQFPIIFEAGNMTDLLALEPTTGFLQEMISFWAKELNSKARLHFLTKSNQVQNILGLDHRGAVRIGFSLNLPEFTQRYELETASIDQRFEAIRAVLQSGYRLHLSFSPIIYRDGALERYEKLFAETKAFLLSCDGFDESDLTVEALILFQKQGGPRLMRLHYPLFADELMRHWKRHRVRSEYRHLYPQHLYDKLRSFLNDCFDRYFPLARVLFIS